jgi:autotransporter-associated beta strand protein
MTRAVTLSVGTLLAAVGIAGPARAQTTINLNALQGLAPFSTLENTAAGRAALSTNFSVTYGIQTGTGGLPTLLPFAQQQQQALKDATITSTNAYQLADGLGTKLGGVYQSLTSYTSTNDGATATSTNISANIANLIAYTYAITGSDSNSGKYFFSNDTTNGTTPASAAATAILNAIGGTTDVYGKAYNLAGGSKGADPYGDSRPYQTEPSVTLYTGADFFGVASGNNAYLNGPTQPLAASPSFPSGHTTYGYTQSVLLALMVPQRFQQMITRGAEYGNDRIVLGAHYAMDIIAGRTIAYYDIAQMLAGNPIYVGQTEGGVTIANYQAALASASSDLTTALSNGCGNTIAVCATQDTSRFASSAADKAFYESTQTYGLPVVYANNTAPENVATLAPAAGYLLQTRFPYLTLQQADDVLTSTEGPGGGFLDNGSSFGVYSRLDLYTAANGYGAFAANVSVTMNAALGGFNAFDTWSNNISGPGGFTLNGTGTLQFSGANTYTGSTTIAGGTLVVTGSQISPTLVAQGGTLAGTGSLAALTVSGTVAPGLPAIASPTGAPSIGRLSATGPVSFTPGAVYAVKFSPTAGADTITTSGTATLAGGVQATGAAGAYKFNQSYPILDAAAGVSGKFQSLSASAIGLTNAYLPTLAYGPTEVDLVLAPNTISSQLPNGGTANVRGIAAGLDSVLLTGKAPAAFVNLFNIAPTALPAAIKSLSGEVAASTETSALHVGDQFLTMMLDPFVMGGGRGTTVRLAQNATPGVAGDTAPVLPGDPLRTVWATLTGGTTTTSGTAGLGASKVTDQTYGIAAGADYHITPQARLGFALGAGGTETSVNSGLGSSTGAYGQFGVNGLYDLGPIYVAAAAAYTHGSFDTTRSLALGGADRLKASPAGDLLGGRVEAGYTVAAGPGAIIPYAAVEAQSYASYNAPETAALAPTNFGLIYRSTTTDSVQTELGARGVARFVLSPSMDLTAFGRLAWAHEADRTRAINASFTVLPGGEFTIQGARPSANAALASLGAQLDLHNGFKVAASADGDFSSNVTGFRGELSLRYDW